jgi:hypothetical protein
LILSREIIRILSIYSNARCAQQPAPSLKDFRQKFVGASALSLSSYLAQYIIASSDSNEELSSSTVAALITVIELAVMFERKLQTPLYRLFFHIEIVTFSDTISCSQNLTRRTRTMAIKKHFVRCFRSLTTTYSHGKQNVKCRVFSSRGTRHEQSHHQRTCFESVETLDFYSTEIQQNNHIKYVNTCSI